MSIEVLELMNDPLRELEHLSKLASADPSKRFSDLYRLVGHWKLLALAAERVRQNTGGRTAGIDGQTRKAIDTSMLSPLAEELASHRYQPQAVRRVYIPKGKSGLLCSTRKQVQPRNRMREYCTSGSVRVAPW